MILANFEQGMDRVFTASVHQWDYGQQLRITGLNLPPVAEVHFCVESDTSTITAVGVTTADHTDVDIPDGLLQQTELIKAYVYVADPEQGKTIRTVIIPVNARQKPQIPHSPEDAKLFRDAIQAVNESANRSAESEKQAKRWAIGEPVIAGSDIDNAKYYSEQAKADATKTDADKKAVAELVKKTANISQQVVEVEKLSKEVIDNALKVDADAKQVSTDKQAVDTAKQEVDAAKQAIDSAKTAVDNAKRAVDLQKQNIDNTVTDFGMLAQTGLDAINQAGTNNINAVNNEGKVQKQAVTDEGTVQKKAVTDTGTAEVGKVAAEGTKQLKSVQDAAAGIVADRQQIQKNATDVTTLREDLTQLDSRKADAIISTASGENITITDSDNEKLSELRVYGQSEQNGVPSPTAPVPIVNKGINTIKVSSGKAGEEQVVTLSKPIELRGLKSNDGNVTIHGQKYISDVICKKNDVIGVERNCNLLDKIYVGETGFGGFGNGNNYIHVFTNTKYENVLPISDRYIGIKYSNESGHVYIPDNGQLIIVDSRFTTKEVAINILKTENPHFLFMMQEPIFEPLPQADQDAIKALMSYYPNTIIETRAWTEVDYVADTKTYILNRESAMQKQISDIQKALISQKISGGIIKAENCAKLPVKNLRLFGKSTQNGVPNPTAPIPIVSVGDKGSVNVSVDNQKLVLSTPSGLLGIKVSSNGNYTDITGQQWVCDRIIEKDGVIGIERNIGKAILNGSEEWQKVSLEQKFRTIIADAKGKNQKNELICNRYKYGKAPLSNSCYHMIDNYYNIEFFYENMNITSEEFMNNLKSNPVELFYVLGKTTFEPLSPTEQDAFRKLYMNYPITTISNDENADMELEYTVDTKSYIDKKIAEISGAVIAQKGA